MFYRADIVGGDLKPWKLSICLVPRINDADIGTTLATKVLDICALGTNDEWCVLWMNPEFRTKFTDLAHWHTLGRSERSHIEVDEIDRVRVGVN